MCPTHCEHGEPKDGSRRSILACKACWSKILCRLREAAGDITEEDLIVNGAGLPACPSFMPDQFRSSFCEQAGDELGLQLQFGHMGKMSCDRLTTNTPIPG